MGVGHGHPHDAEDRLRVVGPPRLVVLALIAACGLAAVLGVLHWWPDGRQVQQVQGRLPVVAGGVAVVPAELVRVRAACSGDGDGGGCGDSAARLLQGDRAGRTVAVPLTPDVIATGLRARDRVLLFDLSRTGGGYAFSRADRGAPLLWLAVLFAIVVVLVVRLRGAMALLSLAFAAAVVVAFLVPALLTGRPPVPVTVAAAVLILIVILYATHGPSLRTSVALLGALTGVGLSVGFAWLGVLSTRLGGLGDDAAALLEQHAGRVDVQQLVIASVVIAGLGTLNDITVTQASAVWELRGASPGMSGRELFRRAMRIGRDHVASSVYTLVFAYLGTALVLIVAVQLYRGSLVDFTTAEDVALEVVRTLVGGLALVLAMPVTTAIAVAVARGARD